MNRPSRLAEPPSRPRGPDRVAALAQYRRRAPWYDLELALFEPIRREAIALLELEPGQRVLDVGCGTGLSLAALRDTVGARGAVVGIEQSPEMIARARRRVARHGWGNVTLLGAPAEAAPLEGDADAALLHFTHDILRRGDALDHLLAHLRPGARIVASGLKWARGARALVNLAVLPAALHSVSTLEGLDEPWSELAARVDALQVRQRLFGAVFVACARAPRSSAGG